MSKTCYKKGVGSTIMELDIYSDMNLSIDKDCPMGWSEDVSSTEGYQGPIKCDGGASVDETTTCYKCDGNMRQVVTHCGDRECPNTYSNYPIKCNYPGAQDLASGGTPSYDVIYCACQESDSTVTGYSPLCCAQQSSKFQQSSTTIPVSSGISKIPWFAWIVVGLGVAYFFRLQDKKIKNK